MLYYSHIKTHSDCAVQMRNNTENTHFGFVNFCLIWKIHNTMFLKLDQFLSWSESMGSTYWVVFDWTSCSHSLYKCTSYASLPFTILLLKFTTVSWILFTSTYVTSSLMMCIIRDWKITDEVSVLTNFVEESHS